MSVAGIDVGNAASCVAVARKRGVDVLLNKESKRETPTLVSFGAKVRAMGTDAVGALTVNPRNTVSGLKRLIAARWDTFQDAAARLPYAVVPGRDGGVAVKVTLAGEEVTVSPESLLAAIIFDQKAVAAADGSPVTDCVLTVPAYWTQAEREKVLAAAEIAGVSCLRLLHDTTAAALAYGIYKTDLPPDAADGDADAPPPLRVAFVDAGATAVQVSIVAFTKGKLQVLSHAWDAGVGGDAYDDALFEHWAAKFGAQHSLDVKASPKSSFRLRLACEKLKKLLSGIPEAQISCEGLGPDVDASGMMSRDEYNALTAPLTARLAEPMRAALDRAGLTAADVAIVEVIGGASRAPALLETVESVFGRPPSRTLNAKECVARGAALACAMLSPIFRVRAFDVVDAFPFGVQFAWDKDGAPTASTLFEAGGPLPSAKVLTFVRADAVDVTAAYTADSPLPDGAPRDVGAWTIGPPLVTPARPAGDKAKLKVKVRLSLHGVVGVDYCQQVEEETYEETVAAGNGAAATATRAATADGDAAMADAAADGDGAAAAAAAATGDAAATAEAPMEADDAPATTTVTKTRTKKHTVGFDARRTPFPQALMTDLCESELQMQLAAKQQAETDERKNALEAYILSTRSSLADAWYAYASDAERESLGSALNAAEDWLYEDGEDAPRAAYVDKLAALKAAGGDRVAARVAEAVAGPAAAAELRAAAEGYVAAVAAPAAAHIAEAERDRVASEAAAALAWLAEKEAAAAAAPKTADPVLVAADVRKRAETLARVADPVLATPKPKKEEPKPEAKAEEEDAAPAPAEDAMDADAAGAGEEEGGEAPMAELE